LIDHEERIFQRLTGKYKHYCAEWDFMAIDETFPEFEACLCYNMEKEKIMKTFDTYETVAEMAPCMKRPIVVHAKQIQEEFRVNSLEGDYKQGKPGDYLMKGIDGELYICDREIFERTYDFVK
jgi:hypothetical protein